MLKFENFCLKGCGLEILKIKNRMWFGQINMVLQEREIVSLGFVLFFNSSLIY